jgi:hypothetical protein
MGAVRDPVRHGRRIGGREGDMPEAQGTITRMTPADAGMLVDGVHGYYATVRMVDIATAHGWVPSELDAALIESRRHPERDDVPEILQALADSDSLPECWEELVTEVQDWLDLNVAPDGHLFGWEDGSFYLASQEWWCEAAGSGYVCDDESHHHRKHPEG